MAAALELEYLHSKRGRGAAAPWAPDRADSELALVQFSKHGISTIAQRSSNSSSSNVKQARPVVASRRMQLQQLSGLQLPAMAGNGNLAAGRRYQRTDHDRLGQSRGDCLPLNTASLQSLSSFKPLQLCTMACFHRSKAHRKDQQVCWVSFLKTVQQPGKSWFNAGLEPEIDSGPVAPLLQQVAADVKHFVKTCGLSRMPTRSEMHSEGENTTVPMISGKQGDLKACCIYKDMQKRRPSLYAFSDTAYR